MQAEPHSNNRQNHWEQVYQSKAPDQVSWYRPHLDTSLHLIERALAGRHHRASAALIDVGGGAATLVDDLLAAGYANLAVLDISQSAIEVAKARLAAANPQSAHLVRWLQADVTGPSERIAAPQSIDLWHDRAVFHFLTDAADRAAYVRNVARCVKPGGHVIVSTFGPEGPRKCSGLDVVRYNPDNLHSEFGARFQLIESTVEIHETPFGSTQQFVYCYCTVEPAQRYLER